MVDHPHVWVAVLRRIVLATKFARIQQNAQDLWVCPSRPLRHQEQTAEHKEPAEKTPKQIESCRAHNQRNKEQLPFRAKNGQRLVNDLVCRVNSALCLHTSLTPPYDPGKSQERKLTAAIAMPMPKTIPANMRLFPPSPKANIKPPTTMATRLRPFAIGPVKAFCSCCTAFSQGLPPACSRMSVSIVFILHVPKTRVLAACLHTQTLQSC